MNKHETLQLLRQHTSPLGKQLMELFSSGEQHEVPKDPERYAVAAQIVLQGGATTMGALSLEPSGVLRMDQPALVRDPQFQHAPPKAIIARHYFEVHNIVALIVIVNAPDASPQPKIIT